MSTLNYRTLPIAITLLVATSCTHADQSVGNVADTGSATADSIEDQHETGGETDGGIDPDDSLAACRELPGAASWIEGDPLVSTAESTEARMSAAGAQTWPLALDLMRVVGTNEASSVAASPASMYAAMGMSYGRWQKQPCGDRIAEVMAFPELEDDLHATLGASIREIESRSRPAADDVDAVVVSLRQTIWEFGADTVSEPTPLMEAYGAVQNGLGAPNESARELINCVIEAQSQGLLPDFLPPEQPAADTMSYDINVAYLQAPWAGEMVERSLQFHFADGSSAQVDGFGSTLAEVELYEGESFLSIELALWGSQLAMMAVLPNDPAVALDDFTAAVTTDALATARDEAHSAIVDLTMPKVKLESMTLDYDEGRLDFECEPFSLRSVLHGAALEMDHKGIKAAAATVSEGWCTGETGPERTLEIDRPFLFFVYDRPTGFVLYSGRYSPDQGG